MIVSLAFLVVEEHTLLSTSQVPLRTSYKIKVTQHKHTFQQQQNQAGQTKSYYSLYFSLHLS